MIVRKSECSGLAHEFRQLLNGGALALSLRQQINSSKWTFAIRADVGDIAIAATDSDLDIKISQNDVEVIQAFLMEQAEDRAQVDHIDLYTMIGARREYFTVSVT
jgi:hypothetical protein